jgi:3,4-dihydroxy 2-butanone 4-phosphate synthase/GTP cyclohydrolase II
MNKKIAKKTYSKKNNFLSSIEEIIEDAKNGKMFILIDDENRENEGDLVIAAEKCDAEKINFMAKYGRGLICLTLAEKRVRDLNLPLMSQNNGSRHQTAFTVSIEAKEGISTGISAFDRAKTIADAINPKKSKDDIVSPGHIFPLKAENGGVLVRAGHTEASVDISILANLNPSAVICEIMNDDGSMARTNDLIKFAQKHRMKIATIADLIEYRRKNEKLVKATGRRKFIAKNGAEFEMITYLSKIDNVEHIALIKGEIDSAKPILTRMHHLNIFSDCIAEKDNPRNGVLVKAMNIINKNKSGVIVIIRQPNEKIEDLLFSQQSDFNKNDISKINRKKQNELRNYGIGAQILTDIGVREMILLTNSKKSIIGLEGYNLKVVGYKKL